MTKKTEVVVVLGATGQQGGATASALVGDGWRVRAIVRDPASDKAKALAASGIEVVRGDLGDRASLDAAFQGAYGVFSVQPSSAQLEYGVTDADEARFGCAVADAAKAAGVAHLVYTSVGGLGPGTGVGHFESKWSIEQHIRAIGVPATLLRPGMFMELILLPQFGLPQGTLVSFVAPDRPIQLIAVQDIGTIAARVFADPRAHLGATIELAGDSLTGNEIVAQVSRATQRSIAYAQFPLEAQRQNETLRRLVELVDDGAMCRADVGALRQLHPGLLTFDAWLERTGAAAITRLLAGAP